MVDVCDNKAPSQRVQGLFLDHALEDVQHGIAAATARPQQNYRGMTAGREAADIGEVQVERDKEPTFRNRAVPDRGVVCAAESFVRHALGGIAGPVQEVGMGLGQVLVQLD
jgi:hypothetical protein